MPPPPKRLLSRSAYHPELRRAAPFLPRRAVSERTLGLTRWLTQRLLRGASDDIEVHDVGDIHVRLHRPPRGDGPHPALLWIHGGGFVMGTAAQDDRTCRGIAEELGAVVASVEYRLAPEHPFPTPLHDCHDALEWLASRDDVDTTRVAIGGASAGGGLAAGLALLARERDAVSPVAQILVYPMLDDRTATDPGFDDTEVRLWDNKANRFGWAAYLGQPPGSASVPPPAAPARNEDLSGLPPAWIGVGTLDLFHDEDVAYAERLRTAGVECELHVVEGAFHGFDALAKTEVAKAFTRARDQVLAAAFAG
ncbi:MAG: alpha/beta hydrolase [Acidimicrobiales bacterium]|nr:alpha/beta hydrolase [Acidimicrobiales bacterium]